ncbi:hypothetical protein D5R81_10340 [Parashewanella spongiae]|uniref:GlyGly-CTERM sorting domain-containing protein n=1 Tax=Parashewanella spongiae TaxID=342950 RepID=A0A3A6TQ34_9GAMM|nr:PKD domain-containing protein [Parashewanella spongiae]MCL1078316.1 PKD domain-containing protein [Parashewanella spongiae]RJY15039.1 hypothetical protein D5R81_10340 [Parashewanella spongiae]
MIFSWFSSIKKIYTLTVSVIEDEVRENEEQFAVVLESVDDSVISGGDSTIKIIDNDRANTAPVVSAGDDRSVNAGETVSLTASATDAEGDALAYQWRQVNGETVELAQSNSATTSFVAPQTSSELTFEVTVTDSFNAMIRAQVNISVIAVENQAPQLTVSAVQDVSGRSSVTLSANATDPENQALSYQWSQKSGDNVSLSNNDKDTASFVAPNKTTVLIFEVMVSDTLGATSTAEVRVNVTEIVTTSPPSELQGQSSSGGALSWLLISMLLLVRRRN